MKISEREKQILPKEIALLPKNPGVYIFYGKNKLLYIGKASNLKERIKNHFLSPTSKDGLFIDKVKKVGYISLGSEIEALIDEGRLIKKYQPKFNVLFRDDKNYFFVGVTKETWPRVFWTHQRKKSEIPNSKLKIEYLGPFTDGKALKETLKILRRTFPYRSCKKLPKKPCLYYQLNLCFGPCLIERGFQRMPELKNQYQKLKREYQKNIQYLKGILKKGKEKIIKNLKKEMKVLAQKEEFEEAGKIKQKIESLEKTFLHRLIFIEKKEKKNLGEMLKKSFKLSKIPERIEGYDISNIKEKEMAGSMIVFSLKDQNFEPDKKWYRRFKIKTLKKQNDVGALREILKRRFSHKEWPFPDLIFIDGGKTHLGVAKKTCPKKKKIFFISLAKKKNILYNNNLEPLPLDKYPQEIKMLIFNLRDEAHRFAQAYHKILRKKRYSL